MAIIILNINQHSHWKVDMHKTDFESHEDHLGDQKETITGGILCSTVSFYMRVGL